MVQSPKRHRLVGSNDFRAKSPFLWLAWSVGGYNAQVGRVFTVGIVALVCLAIRVAAHIRINRTIKARYAEAALPHVQSAVARELRSSRKARVIAR